MKRTASDRRRCTAAVTLALLVHQTWLAKSRNWVIRSAFSNHGSSSGR